MAAYMKSHLEHLKHHVKWPADKPALIAACNGMSDWAAEDKAWFTSTLPDGNYKAPTEVVNALLAKV